MKKKTNKSDVEQKEKEERGQGRPKKCRRRKFLSQNSRNKNKSASIIMSNQKGVSTVFLLPHKKNLRNSRL